MIEAIYFDGFLLLFFSDGVNPVFCYAISSAQGDVKHQILEMTGTYSEI